MTNRFKKTEDGLLALAELFEDKNSFLLLSHENPDGDALGSMLALGRGLKSRGKSVAMFNSSGLSSLYSFLPGSHEVTDRIGSVAEFDAAVLLDCHELRRAGERAIEAASIPILAVLDHHEVLGQVHGDIIVIDPEISAVGELVYRLLVAMKINIDPQMALNLFTAISTDTGSFNYNNTTAESLETAGQLVRLGADPLCIYRELEMNSSPERLNLLSRALAELEFYHQGRVGGMTISREMMCASGATEEATESLVNYPRSVRGVELAFLLTEGTRGSCHVSLRSRGRMDAAHLAASFGGGGHHDAAGFTKKGSVDEIKKLILDAAWQLLPVGGVRECP